MTATVNAPVFAKPRTDNFVFSPVRGRNRAKSFELVPGERASISIGMKQPEYIPMLVTNECAFIAWIDQAAPGDVLEYHRGHLALDIAAHGAAFG